MRSMEFWEKSSEIALLMLWRFGYGEKLGQQPLLNLQSEDVHTGSALEFDLSRRWLPGGDAKESTWRMTATGHLMVCGHCNCIGMGFAMLELGFASSMGFVILLPKKKVMCPCSELALLRKFANMAFIYWLLSRAQVCPIVD
ncbi:unnamed protein product [Sphagnum troendelagicum]|uniref:Uncharacterized protein n=1 Tax=Sphagnum troendelagicum TaxID=128251 RepID=A0ABP0UJA1_9BRYO